MKPRRRRIVWLAAAAAVVLLASIGHIQRSQTAAAAPVSFDYQVVNVYPHDPDAFTQGLVFQDGVLFESTGRYGQSALRRVRLETGEVLQERRLDPMLFGEGLTEWSGRLVQITWREQTGFVYDRETFALLQTFSYPGEGWGLTHDGRRLIMSDGTADLRFLDPATFAETGRLRVTEDGRPVSLLNELEMMRDVLLANVWGSDDILVIGLRDGRVRGRIDLTGLLPAADRAGPVDVLNGIAYDAEGDRLFVTGKLWPKLFEIRIAPRP